LQVAFRALGFELKKAEAMKILNDHDKENTQRIDFDSFFKVGEFRGIRSSCCLAVVQWFMKLTKEHLA
jgi:Ca2+-binding EF-hand superfamily protein